MESFITLSLLWTEHSIGDCEKRREKENEIKCLSCAREAKLSFLDTIEYVVAPITLYYIWSYPILLCIGNLIIVRNLKLSSLSSN